MRIRYHIAYDTVKCQQVNAADTASGPRSCLISLVRLLVVVEDSKAAQAFRLQMVAQASNLHMAQVAGARGVQLQAQILDA